MKVRRKQRLLDLLASPRFKGNRAKLIDESGLTKGRIAQLLDPTKPFGDNAAERLVIKLGLPDDYFDQEPDQAGKNWPSKAGESSTSYASVRALKPKT